MAQPDWQEWIEIYLRLTEWEIELDHYPDLGLLQTLQDQKRSCNLEFARFIEQNYPHWIHDQSDAPVLSVDIVAEHLVPLLTQGRRIVLLIIDSLRLDQWMAIEPLLFPYFHINKSYYYSILPTATPFSRNAIFSGLYPIEIEEKYPDLWQAGNDDDFSRNRYEHQFLNGQLKSMGFNLNPESKYIKIVEAQESKELERNLSSYIQTQLLAIVVNFVDIIAHSRSTSEILREIVPDEAAFRSLTRSWFGFSNSVMVRTFFNLSGIALSGRRRKSDHCSNFRSW